MRCAHNNIEAESPCLACEIERLQAENAALKEALGDFKDLITFHRASEPNLILPWNGPDLRGWAIVGMNHYHVEGERRLFVAMTMGDRCIKAEGPNEVGVFNDLTRAALAPKEDEGSSVPGEDAGLGR